MSHMDMVNGGRIMRLEFIVHNGLNKLTSDLLAGTILAWTWRPNVWHIKVKESFLTKTSTSL